MPSSMCRTAVLQRSIGWVLCGAFDVLAGKFFGRDNSKICYHLHWRYLHDTPELSTVVRIQQQEGEEEGEDTSAKHFGYFRDDPGSLPCCVCASSPTVSATLTPEGSNLFEVLYFHLVKAAQPGRKGGKGGDPAASIQFEEERDTVLEHLQEFCDKHGYGLGGAVSKSKAFVARKKAVVGPTFNKMGIVVPFANDVGYRDLPYSDAALAKLFERMASELNANGKANCDELDELLTLVTFANDEGDPGMGLQLGIDLFCSKHHKMLQKEAYNTLSLAYSLLHRHVFRKVARAHIRHRYRSCLSQLTQPAVKA